MGERWCVVYRVSVERVWSSGWGGGGDLQGPAPHTDKRESNANPPRNALRTSKHRNALWWSVLEPDLYKCITAPWKLGRRRRWWTRRGTEKREEERYLFVFYWLARTFQLATLEISHLSRARNIDARVPRPIFIILPRPIFLIDKFRQSIIRRLSFRIVLARFF